MRFGYWGLVVLVTSAVLWGCSKLGDANETASGIQNVMTLEEGLLGGSRPSQNGFQWLRSQGIKTVIDLRQPEEGTEADRVIAESQGLQYRNVPVSREGLAQGQLDPAVTEALKEESLRPAFVYCASGNRVSMTWKIYQEKNKIG